MNDDFNILNQETACPDMDTFYRYVDGRMESKELRQFEMHLADCPFCADALEGFERTSHTEATEAVNDINTAINRQSSDHRHFQPKQWHIWMAASIVASLLLIGTYLFIDNPVNEELALKKGTAKESEPVARPEEKESAEVSRETQSDTPQELSETEQDEMPSPPKSPPPQKAIEENLIATKTEPSPEELNQTQAEAEDDKAGGEPIAGAREEEIALNETSVSKRADKDDRFSSGFGSSDNVVSSEPKSSSLETDSESPAALPNDAIAFAEITAYGLMTPRPLNENRKTTEKTNTSYKRNKKSKEQAMSTAEPEFYNSNIQTGIELYNRKKYNSSIDYFDQVIEQNGDKASWSLIYKTMALYHLKQFEMGLNTLESAEISESNPAYPTSLWLKIHLKKLLTKDYQEELNTLSKVDSPYRPKLDDL